MNTSGYEIYNQQGCDSFAGGWEQFILVKKKSGKVVGHFWTWDEPAVQHDWDPSYNGAVGEKWDKRTRQEYPGFRKMRKSFTRDRTLDWALDCLYDYL